MRFKNLFAIGLAAAAAVAAVGIMKKHDAAIAVQWKDAKDDEDTSGVVHPNYTPASEKAADSAPEQDKAPQPVSKEEPQSPVSEDEAIENSTEMPDNAAQAGQKQAVDPRTIACEEDFKNWDELGCQG